MFTLTIKTDNAAFHADDAADEPGDDSAVTAEVARILRQLAETVEAGGEAGAVRDVNGNTVGAYRLDA